MTYKLYNPLTSLINLVIAAVEVLLVLRLVLKFFGANTATPFVQWVYDTTAPIIAPFRGIFVSPTLEGQYVLEFQTIFAIIIYAIVGYLLVALVGFVASTTGYQEDSKRKKRK